MIELEIPGYHPAQRYTIKQTLVAVQKLLQEEFPDFSICLRQLKCWSEIEPYAPVLSAPSLVVSEKLVCVGRIPSKQEIIGSISDTMDG